MVRSRVHLRHEENRSRRARCPHLLKTWHCHGSLLCYLGPFLLRLFDLCTTAVYIHRGGHSASSAQPVFELLRTEPPTDAGYWSQDRDTRDTTGPDALAPQDGLSAVHLLVDAASVTIEYTMVGLASCSGWGRLSCKKKR